MTRTLGIETSCDETAAAVVDEEGRTLANVVWSQVTLHADYGGVVPELASRAHARNIHPVVTTALEQAGITPQELTGIAVTAGPGLIGALLVGVAMAKGLALALDRPMIGIHHLEGHLLSPFLDPECVAQGLDFPFVALLVSGGHTLLVLAQGFGDYQRLGGSRDDAVGEAFDKGATLLGLDYPGGPALARAAAGGNPKAIAFPRARVEGLDFSFSGVKTALRTLVRRDGVTPEQLPDVAASYQEALVAALTDKAVAACRLTGVPRLVVAGGVGANQRLRQVLGAAPGVTLLAPPPALCTDNGAMIALAGSRRLARGESSPLDLDARPRWPLPPMVA